jgi:hypothetical protein
MNSDVNFTSEFLNREDNSRDLLGKQWQDKAVSDRSKRRLLQSIGEQSPCAKLLKLWGLQENNKCRLFKRLHPDVTPWLESLGHIQARCPVLRKPRIAVHHGIWRELLTVSRTHTTAVRGNGTFHQLSARPLMTNGQFTKSSYIKVCFLVLGN